MWGWGESSTAEQLFVYQAGPTERVDVLKIAEWEELRGRMQRWAEGVSNVDGCKLLLSPEPASRRVEQLGFLHPSIPFLILYAEVRRRGWQPSGDGVAATPLLSPLVSTLSTAQIKDVNKPYLQCLLVLPDLFAKNLPRFLHTKSCAYYKLLMRVPDCRLLHCG